MSAQHLAFRVVHCSSQDPQYPASNLDFSPHAEIQAKTGWRSSVNPTYPIEIIVQLERAAKIESLRIMSHESLISKAIEIFIGQGMDLMSCTFSRLGHLRLRDNESSQFRACELKTCQLNCMGSFMKFVVRTNHANRMNLHSQVGIRSLALSGRLQGPMGGVGNPALQMGAMPNSYGAGPSSAGVENLDPETKRIVQDVENKKRQAAASEDFAKAKYYKDILASMMGIAKSAANLESQKSEAVAVENYDLAQQCKRQIDTLRNQMQQLAMGQQPSSSSSSMMPPPQMQQPIVHHTPFQQQQQQQQQPMNNMMQQPMNSMAQPPLNNNNNHMMQEPAMSQPTFGAPPTESFNEDRPLNVQQQQQQQHQPTEMPSSPDDRPIRGMTNTQQMSEYATSADNQPPMMMNNNTPPNAGYQSPMRGGEEPMMGSDGSPVRMETVTATFHEHQGDDRVAMGTGMHDEENPFGQRSPSKSNGPKSNLNVQHFSGIETLDENINIAEMEEAAKFKNDSERLQHSDLMQIGEYYVRCLVGTNNRLREALCLKLRLMIKDGTLQSIQGDASSRVALLFKVLKNLFREKRNSKKVMDAAVLLLKDVISTEKLRNCMGDIPALLDILSLSYNNNLQCKVAISVMNDLLAMGVPVSKIVRVVIKPVEKKKVSQVKAHHVRLQQLVGLLQTHGDCPELSPRPVIDFIESFVGYDCKKNEVREEVVKVIIALANIHGEGVLSTFESKQLKNDKRKVEIYRKAYARRGEGTAASAAAPSKPVGKAKPKAKQQQKPQQQQQQQQQQRKPKKKAAPEPIVEEEYVEEEVPPMSMGKGGGPNVPVVQHEEPSVMHQHDDDAHYQQQQEQYDQQQQQQGEEEYYDEEGETNSCQYCGLVDDQLLDEAYRNGHLTEHCPALTTCPGCDQIIEIMELSNHLFEECENRHEVTRCDVCFDPIRTDEFAEHQRKNNCFPPPQEHERCPLCQTDIYIAPPHDENAAIIAYSNHLIRDICPGNPRTSPEAPEWPRLQALFGEAM